MGRKANKDRLSLATFAICPPYFEETNSVTTNDELGKEWPQLGPDMVAGNALGSELLADGQAKQTELRRNASMMG